MNWDKNDFLKENKRREKIKEKEEFTKLELLSFVKFKNFINDFVTGIDCVLKLEDSKFEIVHDFVRNGFIIKSIRFGYSSCSRTIILTMNKKTKKVHIESYYPPSEGTKKLLFNLMNFFKTSYSGHNDYISYESNDFNLVMGSTKFNDFILALIADAEEYKEEYKRFSMYGGHYYPQPYDARKPFIYIDMEMSYQCGKINKSTIINPKP